MTHECWNKKILWVNLDSLQTRTEQLDLHIYERFIGGKGLGAYLLYKYSKQLINPLDPQNILILLNGPMQGLPGPTVGRWSAVTKSPLTGLYIDSHCGGPTGRDIKKAGYDAICIQGKAALPTIILIDNDIITFEDGSQYWGKGVYETTANLHEQYGNDFSVYTIGPAGENLVLFATASCEIAHQTGRGGIGAVMGSKNLKAVVIRGTNDIQAFDIEAMRDVNKEFNSKWRKLEIDFKKYGTRHLVELANQFGQFPAENWKNGFMDEYANLDHVLMDENYGLGAHYSCPHCVIRCTHAFKSSDPRTSSQVESMIEYETLGLLGGNLLISEPTHVLQLNYLCDDLGLDTITTGSVIGFAMEAFEKGILTRADFGFDVNFGNVESAIKLIEIIAKRDGVGNTLSKGVKQASDIIGKGSESFAVHVKGLEVAAWDPRGRLGQGVLYATADVGGSHLRGWPPTSDPPNRSVVDFVEKLIPGRVEKLLKDTFVICHFTNRLPLTLEQMTRMFNGASGLSYTTEDMKQVAFRIESLIRMFNIREGLKRSDDSLPQRFWEPQTHGPRKGMRAFVSEEDMHAAIDRYYEIMGWDSDGMPTERNIRELNLDAI
ncbi:MAG: aldehyde ferredoxin oxidoreductase family protein [Candidatus Thorarchaeota archaeon]